jgi:hypothetical protein
MTPERLAEIRHMLYEPWGEDYGMDGEVGILDAACELLAAVKDLLTAYEQATEWQPIETAPKDEEILVYERGRWWREVFTCRWDPNDPLYEDGSWAVVLGNGVRASPTHWKPIGPLPEVKG